MLNTKKASAVFVLVLVLGVSAFSQTPAAGNAQRNSSLLARLQEGINLYGQGRWREAVSELRRVQAETGSKAQRSEALYWIGLAELSAGEYEAALEDMEALEQSDPGNRRVGGLAYHKGRVLYHLGRYNEAIVFLKGYADAVPVKPDGSQSSQDSSKKASALYWIGECLYSLGLLDRAGDVFLIITEEYPQSPKYEAASYRIALINQKKVETELLALLKWSHEESLKTMEEYQRRERSYDQALIAYQKRIADMLKDTRLSDLENENAQYRQQLASAEERIRLLEGELRQALAEFPLGSPSGGDAASNTAARLKAIRSSAEELRNELLKNLNEVSAARGAGK
jgi:TolA-binding protein